MLRKFFRKIIMMAAPSTDYMDRHYVRIFETPTIRPSNIKNNKVNINIKQPKGKESRGRHEGI